MHVEMGVDLPHVAKHAFGDEMDPKYAKSHAVWQSPLSRTEKFRMFSKKYFFISLDLFRPTGYFLRFTRCWPYLVAGILFGGSGRTRKATCNVGLRENPMF